MPINNKKASSVEALEQKLTALREKLFNTQEQQLKKAVNVVEQAAKIAKKHEEAVKTASQR
ncbi:MAG: hypothetical protein ACI9G5_002529, partial [Paracoccaceae bacterium]